MLSNMKGLGRDGSIDKGFKEAKKSLNINGNSTYKAYAPIAPRYELVLGMGDAGDFNVGKVCRFVIPDFAGVILKLQPFPCLCINNVA
jgi:hypothetical protein